MYKLELESNIEKLFDKKIIDNNFAMTKRTLKEEINDWIKFHNMNIKCEAILLSLKIDTGAEYTKEYFESFRDFKISIFKIIEKIILYFDTEEERNLFKLTWI